MNLVFRNERDFDGIGWLCIVCEGRITWLNNATTIPVGVYRQPAYAHKACARMVNEE
jgi:hypothetical protein